MNDTLRHLVLNLDTESLKELLDQIEIELSERNNEKEKCKRQYQEEFDALLERIEADGFQLEDYRVVG